VHSDPFAKYPAQTILEMLLDGGKAILPLPAGVRLPVVADRQEKRLHVAP